MELKVSYNNKILNFIDKDKMNEIISKYYKAFRNINFKILPQSDSFIINLTIENFSLLGLQNIKIIKKKDSEPSSITDGTAVVTVSNNTEMNYIDDNIDSSSTYFYSLFITTNDEFQFHLNTIQKSLRSIIYGFKIDKMDSNPFNRISYTDDAVGMTPLRVDLYTGTVNYGSWENTFILNSFKPCMLKYNGTVDYFLNPNDYSKKMNGANSDVANLNYAGNAMVQVKKMYLYCYEDDYYQYVKISDIKVDDNYKCYAHINDLGYEVNYIYLPIYEGSVDSNNRIRSISGQPTISNLSGIDEITYAKNNGSGWYMDEFINVKLVENILYLITKSCDNQKSLGSGVCNLSTRLNTGTLDDKGMFYGKSDKVSAVKFLGLENYYGNRYDRIIGLVNNKGIYYIKKSRPYNDDGSFSNYINTGIPVPAVSSSYCHVFCKMLDIGLISVTVNDLQNSYIPGGIWASSNMTNLVANALKGGRNQSSDRVSISALELLENFSVADKVIGCSVCYK